uniref:wall-associated receptor kinase-like 14 n=1 Tax=Erigeron canadensis TaxID=72917 RepID=UPI001CB9126B|nr:wall-associated receptor kinase-like 14 [Erigeron canadensis]
MNKLQNLFIYFVSCIPSIISQNLAICDQSCPGGIFDKVPYPFGFSAGCQIQLNCTSNGTVLIGEFPVRQVNYDGLLISLPIKCGRNADALSQLYGKHYTPTSTSSILMENCTDQMTNCRLPLPISQFHTKIAKLVNCTNDSYGNTSCYSGDSTHVFLNYENITKMGCQLLFTGFLSERTGAVGGPPSATQAIKLGWWIKGSCDCSDGADCTEIVSPFDGSDGYRCKCKGGYNGDGYKARSGCWKLKESKEALLSRKWKLVIGKWKNCYLYGVMDIV